MVKPPGTVKMNIQVLSLYQPRYLSCIEGSGTFSTARAVILCHVSLAAFGIFLFADLLSFPSSRRDFSSYNRFIEKNSQVGSGRMAKKRPRSNTGGKPPRSVNKKPKKVPIYFLHGSVILNKKKELC